MSEDAGSPLILLVEPQFVLRRTIVALARDFASGSLQEASSIEAAMLLLGARRFDGLVLDLASGTAAFDLLARLRATAFASDADIPVIGMTSEPRHAVALRAKPFDLFRLLDKPFKVRELLNALQRMRSSGPGAVVAA